MSLDQMLIELHANERLMRVGAHGRSGFFARIEQVNRYGASILMTSYGATAQEAIETLTYEYSAYMQGRERGQA